MGVKLHTPGVVRYITYYLIFPGDRDFWVDQVPFVNDLIFNLKNSRFIRDTTKYVDLITKGETHWKDHNSVTHRVVIEATKRNRKWGVPIKR